MSKRGRYDLGAIMRRAWEMAREAAFAVGERARAHLAAAMRSAWAEAKLALAPTKTEQDRLSPSDMIGHEDDYQGRVLKYIGIKPWSSKDGYDKRDYIICEIDGQIKDKGLMYFLKSGQVDLFHIEVTTPFGAIWCHENIEAELLS